MAKMEMKNFRPTQIAKWSLLYLALQRFGHIQSKNIDAKSAVRIFLKLKTVIGFSHAIWWLWYRKGNDPETTMFTRYTYSNQLVDTTKLGFCGVS